MKLVDELEAEWAAELALLEAEIKRLKKALKFVVDSGEQSWRTAKHPYADVIIANSAYEVARNALR